MRSINLKTVTFGISMVHAKQKKCSKCGEVKELESGFHKSAIHKKDGHNNTCKVCRNQYNSQDGKYNLETIKNWKRNNPDKVKEYHRKYYKKNKEKINEKAREWAKNNVEKKKKADRQWRKNNPDKVKERDLRWYKKNKNKRIEYKHEWAKINPEKLKEYSRKYLQNNKNIIHKRSLRRRVSLKDSYVVKVIRLKRCLITPEMIEAKREQLLFHRQLKTLKQEVQNGIT